MEHTEVRINRPITAEDANPSSSTGFSIAHALASFPERIQAKGL
jgi:hypothetical protein